MGSVLSLIAKLLSNHVRVFAYLLQYDDPDPHLEAIILANGSAPEPISTHHHCSHVDLQRADNATFGPNYGIINQGGRDTEPISVGVLCNVSTVLPPTSASHQHNHQDEPKESRFEPLPSSQIFPGGLDIPRRDCSAAGDVMEDIHGEDSADETDASPSPSTGTASEATLSSTENEATSREATKASSLDMGHVDDIVDKQLAYPEISSPTENPYHPPVTDHNAERRAAMQARGHSSSGYAELEGGLPLAGVSDGMNSVTNSTSRRVSEVVAGAARTMPGHFPVHRQESNGSHVNCVTQPIADDPTCVASEDENKPEGNDPLKVILAEAPFTKDLQRVDPTIENIVNERDCAQASPLPEDASAVPVRVPTSLRTTHTHALRSNIEPGHVLESSRSTRYRAQLQMLVDEGIVSVEDGNPQLGFPLKVLTSDVIQLIPSNNGSTFITKSYHPFAFGGFADIYKAKMVSEYGKGRTVVVKVLRVAHLEMENAQMAVFKTRLSKEYRVWENLNHRNILRMEGIAVLDSLPFPALVSEYKELGNLYEMMMKGNMSFDSLHMGYELSSGLMYLHRNRIVHGDLTLANILVELDRLTGLFFPLITDFGWSRNLDTCDYSPEKPRTPSIMSPPELIIHFGDPGTKIDIFSPAFDVYSFSLILLQLVTGKRPYSEERISSYRIMVNIIDPYDPFRPTPEKYPTLQESFNFCWPIMQACWKVQPEERITIGEARSRLRTGMPRTIQVKHKL